LIDRSFESEEYTHSDIYLEDRYDDPKHLFIVLADKMEPLLKDGSGRSFLDVGGATGEFAYYLQKRFTALELTCMDNDQELLEIGRSRVSGCDFLQGDANQMTAFQDKSFDAVSMIGTMNIFNDFAPSLEECIRVTKETGTIFISSAFNEYPIDILIRWRASEDKGSYHTGQNVFSKQSVSQLLEEHPRVKDWSYEKFVLSVDLPQRSDLMRAWTELDDQGNRIQMNGLGIEINQQILTIQVA